MHRWIFALIAIDQITKLIFFGSRDFFFGFLHIHSVKNFGLIFSLNFGLLVNLIIITIALLSFVYYFYSEPGLSRLHKIAFVFVLAGALSNIVDRLYLGFVRDFLDIGLKFTFNLADAFIILGIITIVASAKKDK